MKKRLLVLCSIFTLLDQVVKMIIKNTIAVDVEKNIISGFFYITNVKNTGGAFSILSNNTILLAFVGIIAIMFFVAYILKQEKMSFFETFLYSMLIGGIVGNFIDRIIYRYVIDYLGFIIVNYNFPIFNFADICIVLSVIGLVIYSLKEDICKNSKSKKKLEE